MRFRHRNCRIFRHYGLTPTGLAIAAGLLAGNPVHSQSLTNPFELSSLSGSDGFRVEGKNTSDFLGTDVAYAGDLNGDGLGDVVFGAPYADPGGMTSGEAYVVFGSAAMGTGTGSDPLDVNGDLDLTTLNGTNGFSIAGLNAGDTTGIAVAGNVDVNGDGLDDVLVGSVNYTHSGRKNAGRVSVIFGNTEFGLGTGGDPLGGLAGFDLATLTGANGFHIDGANAYDRAGFVIDGAGDINGDGVDDIVVGSFFADTSNIDAGRAWVVFGTTEFGQGTAGDPLASGRFDLASVNGDDGFVIDGVATLDGTGFSVSRAGNINGDAFDDLLIGSYLADGGGSNRGEAYVVFGTDQFGVGSPGDPLGGGSTFALSSLNGTHGFVLDGVSNSDVAGRSVSGIGDFNDDGIDDFAIGASEADNGGVIGQREGYGYVVFGDVDFGTGAVGDPLSAGRFGLVSLNGINGFDVSGVNPVDRTGAAVSGGADINNDGIPEFIVGAPSADPNGTSSGTSYVVYGTSTVIGGGTLSPSALNGTNGAELRGENGHPSGGDESGGALSMGGDINGDGAPDVIIGSRTANIGTGREGRVHVLFGPPPPDLTAPGLLQVTTDSPDGGYRETDQIEIRLVYDESVLVNTGSGTPTLDLNTGGTATWFAGSGNTVQRFLYTVSALENTTDLDVTAFNLNSGTMKDLAGNDATTTLPGGVDSLAGGHDIVIDTVTPSVVRFESDTAPGTYGVTSMIDVKMIFTEAMSFDELTGTPFLTLNSGGTATYSSGIGTDTLVFAYEVMQGESSTDLDVVSIGEDGTIIGDLADNAANLTLPTSPDTLADNEDIAVDGIGPSIASITSSTADGAYNLGDSISVTVEFDEDLAIDTALGFPRVNLDSGGLATTTSFPDVRTIEFVYSVQNGQNSTDLDATAFAFNGSVIADAYGNTASTALPPFADSLAGNKDIVIDTIAPEIASITSPNSNGNYGIGASLSIDVSFTENIVYDTGGGTPRLNLDTGGIADYSTSPMADVGRYVYTVGGGEVSSDLDVTGFVLNGGTIRDPAGNSLVVSLPTGINSLAGSKDIVVDAGSPKISSFSSGTLDGFYKAGAGIQITADFNKTVTWSGSAPSLSLDSGGMASYSSGNGTAQYIFLYNVLAGEDSMDLSVVSFDTNGGTIVDGSANALDTSLPGSPDRLEDSSDLVVDTTAPRFTSATTTTADGSYPESTIVDVSLNISEAVVVNTVSGTPGIVLNSGGTGTWNGAGSQTLLFDYTVMAGENTSDLDLSSYSQGATTVRDQAGNDLNTTLPGSPDTLADLHDIEIDTEAPRISSFTSIPAAEDYGPGESLIIEARFSEATVANIITSPTLSLDSGGTATWTAITALDEAEFSYTVGAGQDSGDLSVTAVSLFDSGIEDAAGNALDVTLPLGADSLAGGQDIIVDTTRPAPVLSSVDVTNGGTIAGPPAQIFSATFTDATSVAGFDPQNTGDLTVTNATISNSIQSGNTWTFDVTPVADGAVQLQVLENAAVDNVGNPSSASTVFGYTFDTATPSSVVVSGDVASGAVTGAAPPFNFTARFFSALSMSGFDSLDVTDLTLTNATASASVQSANDWDFTITPDSEGTVSLQIQADAAEDTLMRGNTVSPLYSFVYDTTSPGASLASTDVTDGSTVNSPSSFSFTAEFTDATAVDGFDPEDTGDLAVTNATVSTTRKGASSVDFMVTPVSDGAVSLQILASAATDQGGNANTASAVFGFTYDSTPPTVGLSSVDVANGSVVDSPASFSFEAIFSDASMVSGFDPENAGDLAVTNAAVSTTRKGSGSIGFTVTPNADGPISLQVLADAANDEAGNGNTASSVYQFVYDTTNPVPSISSGVVSDGGATNTGSPIAFTVSFADVTDVTGFNSELPSELTLANATGSAATQTGNDYDFTIQPVADGNVLLQVVAGVAMDEAGNSSDQSGVYSFVYDTEGPSAALTSVDVSNGGLSGPPAPLRFVAEFTDLLTVSGFDPTDPADLNLVNASVSNVAVDGNNVEFDVTPVSDGSVSLEVLAGAAVDSLGQASSASAVFSFTWVENAPSAILSSLDVSDDGIVNTPSSFNFTAAFATTGTVSGFDPQDTGDLAVTGATVGPGMQTGNSWSFGLIPTGDGRITLRILSSAVTDNLANPNSASDLFEFDYDTTSPAVGVIGPVASGGFVNSLAPSTLTATFADLSSVTGFDSQDSADISIANATAAAATQVNFNEFDFDVTPIAEGVVSLHVKAGAVTDAAGNSSLVSEVYSYTVDVTAPVPSFSAIGFNDGDTCQCPSPIEVVLDVVDLTAVAGSFDPAIDVTLTNATLDSAVRSGNEWALQVMPIGEGPVSLSVAADALSDSAGNTNSSPASFMFTWLDPNSGVSDWTLY